MYPLNTEAPWPKNQWYIAAFSHEIGDSFLPRRFLGEPVLLLRTGEGVLKAVSDVCPHRMMPLHLGKRIGDTVQCAYHGLTFDADGACVAAPTSSAIPRCSLRSYPVREHAPLVWIWMGDPELAADTPLPDQASIGLGAEGWDHHCTYRYPLQARYSILIDNLFDLSHLAFIHSSILGSDGIALSGAEIERRNSRLVVSREIHDTPTTDYHRRLYPDVGESLSSRLETEMLGVGLINAGSAVWSGPDCQGPALGHMNYSHGVTPEAEGSTHYFIMVSRNFRVGDAAFTAQMAAQNKAVVDQDIDALEAIERVLSSRDLPREISMGSDGGALRARREIITLINSERAAAPA